MAVHWGGYPVDLEGLKKVQKFCLQKYDFEPPIIEDCAHAFGATTSTTIFRLDGTFGLFTNPPYASVK
jgi:dTDP-4-amino-4,6-dideoxygalactose transaminase